jgi:hypothetical protein
MLNNHLTLVRDQQAEGLYTVEHAYDYEYDYFEPSPLFQKDALAKRADERRAAAATDPSVASS